MQEEIWKDIPGYEGVYQVSSLGRVKSLPRKIYRKCGKLHYSKEDRIMSLCISNGYKVICLYKNGKSRKYSLHQLLAMAFLNHTANGFKIVVDHIDNNSLNNNLSNLQIITARENSSKDRKGYSSKFIGVSWSKAAKKWMAYIIIDKKFTYLGCHNNELDARDAYQNKLKEINNQINTK